MTERQFNKIQNKTYSEEIHLVNSIFQLKTRNGWDCIDDGFKIKLKYYSLERLFLTRVLGLQNVFLLNMIYFVFYKGIKALKFITTLRQLTFVN